MRALDRWVLGVCGLAVLAGSSYALYRVYLPAERAGVTLDTKATENLAYLVTADNYNCPAVLNAAFMGESNRGRVYRVDCAQKGSPRVAFQFRVTIQPSGDPSVRPW